MTVISLAGVTTYAVVSASDRETPLNAGTYVGEARRGETTQAMWDAQHRW
jgi:hypothetical protein